MANNGPSSLVIHFEGYEYPTIEEAYEMYDSLYTDITHLVKEVLDHCKIVMTPCLEFSVILTSDEKISESDPNFTNAIFKMRERLKREGIISE